MANIRDIAKHADVSVTTVSRVLNEHPYVSKEKRTRVHAAMKELGYLRKSTGVDVVDREDATNRRHLTLYESSVLRFLRQWARQGGARARLSPRHVADGV